MWSRCLRAAAGLRLEALSFFFALPLRSSRKCLMRKACSCSDSDQPVSHLEHVGPMCCPALVWTESCYSYEALGNKELLWSNDLEVLQASPCSRASWLAEDDPDGCDSHAKAFEAEARTSLLALAMPFWRWFLFWKLVAFTPPEARFWMAVRPCSVGNCHKNAAGHARDALAVTRPCWHWPLLPTALEPEGQPWNQRGFPCWKVAQTQQLRISTRCLPTGSGSCAALWSRRLWWDKIFSSRSSGVDCGKWGGPRHEVVVESGLV